MPRQMRIDFPGASHHVMSRGDRRENIYLDEVGNLQGSQQNLARPLRIPHSNHAANSTTFHAFRAWLAPCSPQA